MMNEEKKMACDNLLKTHEVTRKFLDVGTADTAMLTTLIQMVRDGRDEMAVYMLHNLKPYTPEIVNDGKEEDIDELLNALFG